MENVMVSVYCLAFNHEEYIKDALDGFVMQKTNFKYEVFVHDDASTDNTPLIIGEYARKYPDLIKPIYETYNQYSKGISISREIIFPKMTGKYIAICEGDDFWCDSNKLQKQVDFLENHPEYSACVHNTKQLNCRNGSISLINPSTQDMDLEFEKVVQKGNSQFQLSSVMCRKEFFMVPNEILGNGFGDYPLSIYLMFNGKIRYLKDVMSVYRIFAKNSWTSQHYINATLKKQIKTQENLVDFLQRVVLYSNKENLSFEYINAINNVLRREKANLLLLQNKGRILIKEYKDIYIQLPPGEKLKARFPLIRNIVRKLKLFGNSKSHK